MARQRGENRFTWQPGPGLRYAAVLDHFGGAQPGFVLAARSLREVESRSDQLLTLAVAAAAASLLLTLAAVTLGEFLTPRPR